MKCSASLVSVRGFESRPHDVPVGFVVPQHAIRDVGERLAHPHSVVDVDRHQSGVRFEPPVRVGA